MDRRRFLQSASLVQATLIGAAGCATGSEAPLARIADAPAGVVGSDGPFLHGVASGDPQTDRVILWTRVTPTSASSQTLTVAWWIGTEAIPAKAERRGVYKTNEERDYTVKLDVAGLVPDTQYFYGFSIQGVDSMVGKTRTLPQSGNATRVESVKFAVTSCANYPQGYFNAYRHLAQDESLDAVLCLGDYLYEYANSDYGNGEALDRVPQPDREIVSLNDYRQRHAQYKTDEDLQAAHAAHPWIVVWDDHESTNNSWSGGAQNHNPEKGEGDWDVRKGNAIKAYYEWMPIREVPTGLFRHFRYGDLADLVMLDTRLEGRDEQGGREDFELANDPARTLLGPIQEELFLDHLAATQAAKVRWKLVGQQVVFAPWTDGTTPFNPDSWDGYRAARQRVIDHIANEGVENVVILTGDVHSAWGMEVHDESGSTSHAIELVAPAVSSPPLASTSDAMRQLVARALAEQAHVKYADGLHNGYLAVSIDHQRTKAEWRFTGERTARDEPIATASLECRVGTNRLADA